MNIGSLYRVKKWYWLLFPSKESVSAEAAADEEPVPSEEPPLDAAAYYGIKLKENVIYFSPNSFIVFLEEDGKLKKVLTSEGLIGWIWVEECYFNNCFEEVNQP